MEVLQRLTSVTILFSVLGLLVEQSDAAFTKFAQDCGGTYTDEKSGTISSPGYPDSNYPVNINCTYIIIAPPNNMVAYRSTFMRLEPPESVDGVCVYDRINIYDNDTLQATYCGETPIYLTTATSGRLKLEFITDFETEFEGFSVDWYVLNPDEREISTSCNFDDAIPLCAGWTNINDDYQWLFAREKTPSPNTGPLNDHTTGTHEGRFAYIEGSTFKTGSNATLRSPALLYGTGSQPLLRLPGAPILGLSNKWCLNFWYHMLGTGIGNLTVTLEEPNGETEIARFVGDKGESWLEAKVTFTLAGTFGTLAFNGIRGTNYMSDIAIDDIKITMGSCDSPIPVCAGVLVNFNCGTNCDLTCDMVAKDENSCSRYCSGPCACPLDTPVFENGKCVAASACSNEATTIQTTSQGKKSPEEVKQIREVVHEKIVSEMINALLNYINSNGR